MTLKAPSEILMLGQSREACPRSGVAAWEKMVIIHCLVFGLFETRGDLELW